MKRNAQLKRIEKKHDFIIKKTSKGVGVYANRDYKKGEKIWIFGGKKFTPDNITGLMADFRNGIIDPLQINTSLYLELDIPSIYFNHSCDPNAGFKKHLTLYAIKDIKKNKEIAYDYSTTIDESFVCNCGSKKCRGAISDFFSLPIKLQKHYFSLGVLPSFIKNKLAKRLKAKNDKRGN